MKEQPYRAPSPPPAEPEQSKPTVSNPADYHFGRAIRFYRIAMICASVALGLQLLNVAIRIYLYCHPK